MKKRGSKSFIGQLIAFWQKTETTLMTLQELGDQFRDHPTLAEKSGEKLINFLKTYMAEVRQLSLRDDWPGKLISPVREKQVLIGYRTSEIVESASEKKVKVVGVGGGTKKERKEIWLRLLATTFDGSSSFDQYMTNPLQKMRRIKFDKEGRMINDRNYRYTLAKVPAVLKKFNESVAASELKPEGSSTREPENSAAECGTKAVRRKKGC